MPHPTALAKTDKRAMIPEIIPDPDKKPAEWNLGDALKLRLKNHLSLAEIAEYYGVPRSTVHDRFKRLIKVVGDTKLNQAYDECRAEILTGTERILIENLLDSDKLKAASLNNTAYSLKVINDCLRLERGQSTSNQAIAHGVTEELSGLIEAITGKRPG